MSFKPRRTQARLVTTSQQFLPRVLALVVCVAVGFTLLVLRVIDLQALRFDQFRVLADANRYATRLLPRERGVFLDRYGDPLVSNVPKYYLSSARGDQIVDGFLAHDAVLPLMATQAASISYQLDRRYLFPESTAHVLGYVGRPSAEELLAIRSLRLTDTIGKAALELALDEQLQGTPDKIVYEVNSLGQPQRVLQEVPGTPGMTVQTTLDPYISEVAYQALGDQRGVVLITDTMNGEILSLVSRPSYSATVMSERAIDPKVEAKRKEQVESYITHPQKVFFNRAVSGMYPPGSVFKLVTALAGLEKGSVDAATSVTDEGILKVGEYEYANWYFTQYGRTEGSISLERALARSNDIYFYKVAEWVGPTALAEFARMFGFGHTTSIELPASATGTVPDPIWKEQTIGEQWFLGNTYHFGIGQGDVLVTPVQIAQLVQAMGNNGKLCSPHLIANSQITACSELGITDEHLELVLKGMLAACSSGGTAFPFFEYNQTRRQPELSATAELEKGAVACKTGTAEFGAADHRGYRPTHGWFVATLALPDLSQQQASAAAEVAQELATESAQLQADKNQPLDWQQLYEEWQRHVTDFPKKISITVLVESDEAQLYKEGSRDAAPIAKKIVDWMHGQAQQPVEERDTHTEGE